MTFIPHNQLKGFFEHYLTFEKQFGNQQGKEKLKAFDFDS